jgi:hypothetical protein
MGKGAPRACAKDAAHIYRKVVVLDDAVIASTLHTVQCVRGGGGLWGSGPQTDKNLPHSPFTGQIF